MDFNFSVTTTKSLSLKEVVWIASRLLDFNMHEIDYVICFSQSGDD